MASHFLLLPLLAMSLLSLFANGSATNISHVDHEVLTGTNSDDVKGLTALRSKFVILQVWSGDPCTGLMPWSWILCNTDSTPRVTALYLGNFALIGQLPDFGSMDALKTIDLSSNYLTGPIPDFLGTLPNLQELNLENNDFRGTIPSSLSKNSKLTLMVAGNSNLCESDKSCKKETDTNDYMYSNDDYVKKKKSNKLAIILGILIPAFVIFWVLVGLFAVSRHKRNAAAVAAITAGAATTNQAPVKEQEGGTMPLRMDQEQGYVYTNDQNQPAPPPHQQPNV